MLSYMQLPRLQAYDHILVYMQSMIANIWHYPLSSKMQPNIETLQSHFIFHVAYDHKPMTLYLQPHAIVAYDCIPMALHLQPHAVVAYDCIPMA